MTAETGLKEDCLCVEYEGYRIYPSKKWEKAHKNLNDKHRNNVYLCLFHLHYPDIKIDPSKVKEYIRPKGSQP
jgi:hypothetical protein